MSAWVDKTIEKYFGGLLRNHGLRLIDEGHSMYSQWRDYVGGNIFLKIVVDDQERPSISVFPVSNRDRQVYIDLCKNYLEPPTHGAWKLSLKEQVEYLDANWDWFDSHLSTQEAARTLDMLDDFSKKGAHLA